MKTDVTTIPANRGRAGYGKPPVEHQFQPGQSGNPAGRPKNAGASIVEWINILQDMTEAELRRIVEDGKAPIMKRVAAQRWLGAARTNGGADFDRIMDRIVGRPKQALEHSGPEQGTVMRHALTFEDAVAIVSRISPAHVLGLPITKTPDTPVEEVGG